MRASRTATGIISYAELKRAPRLVSAYCIQSREQSSSKNIATARRAEFAAPGLWNRTTDALCAAQRGRRNMATPTNPKQIMVRVLEWNAHEEYISC
jgi:hypothetical protein